MKALDGSTLIIEEVQNECDLGIAFDTKLSFKEHIAQIVNKANSVIGMIKRTFQHMDEKMLLHLYETLIRPIVEYGNVIWYPHLKKVIVAIEKIQRRATRIVPTLRYLQYKERLQHLYLTTLEVRRVVTYFKHIRFLMVLMRLIISYFLKKSSVSYSYFT